MEFISKNIIKFCKREYRMYDPFVIYGITRIAYRTHLIDIQLIFSFHIISYEILVVSEY